MIQEFKTQEELKKAVKVFKSKGMIVKAVDTFTIEVLSPITKVALKELLQSLNSNVNPELSEVYLKKLLGGLIRPTGDFPNYSDEEVIALATACRDIIRLLTKVNPRIAYALKMKLI